MIIVHPLLSKTLQKSLIFEFDYFVFSLISAVFVPFPIYTSLVIIFTFKNLKFSELSKICKLIHLSFIEVQRSPFPEKSLPGKELHKR